jgi:hypothetical protein
MARILRVSFAVAIIVFGWISVASSQGNRPRQAASPPALKARLYMVGERGDFMDVSDFKDMASCQASANGAKIIKAQETGSSGGLNVIFKSRQGMKIR